MSEPVKLGGTFRVSGQLLVPDYLAEQMHLQLQVRTEPGDPAARERRVAEQRELAAAEHAAHVEQHGAVVQAADHPVLLAVLELHRPRRPEYGPWPASECHGCPGDAEYGAEAWPCETWQLVADRLQS